MGAGVWPGRSSKSSRARRGAPEVALARRPQVWHRRRWLLRVVVAVAFVVVVVSQRRSLLAATDRLGRVSPAWLVLAVAAETLSFLAAAELQHQLLAGTGTRVDRRSLIALSYAATAMSASLPAGPAVSGRYTYRALTCRGSTAGAAAWVLAAAAVLSTVSLALLGVIGAQLRGLGGLGSLLGGAAGVAVVLVAAGAVAALVWSSRHRRRLERLVRIWSARGKVAREMVARRLGLPTRPADADTDTDTDTDTVGWLSGAGVDQHRAIGPARLSVALGLAGANWLLDAAALAIAFVALGLAVPWQGLLLAYAVTQLATSIPLLPGSIGVAEASMSAALVCSGIHPSAAVAGVLVYRLVSFWLVLPAGWLAWRYLDRRQVRPLPRIDRPSRQIEPAAASAASRISAPTAVRKQRNASRKGCDTRAAISPARPRTAAPLCHNGPPHHRGHHRRPVGRNSGGRSPRQAGRSRSADRHATPAGSCNPGGYQKATVRRDQRPKPGALVMTLEVR